MINWVASEKFHQNDKAYLGHKKALERWLDLRITARIRSGLRSTSIPASSSQTEHVDLPKMNDFLTRNSSAHDEIRLTTAGMDVIQRITTLK